MKKSTGHKSLSYEIRKRFKQRIYIALVLISLLPIIMFVLSCEKSIDKLKNTLLAQNKDVGDYIIGQLLVNNKIAVTLKLDSFNKNNIYKIRWISNPKYATINKSFNINFNHFTFIYPLEIDNIPGSNFGYLITTGHIPLINILDKSLIEIILLILIFALLLYALLIPLAEHIPHNLILKPIQHILQLTEGSTDISNAQNQTMIYEEIVAIEEQIKVLINKIEIQSLDVAVGKLSREIAHDIKSPLSNLQSCESKLSSIMAIDKNLLKSIKISIDSIKYILINLLNININQSITTFDNNIKTFVILNQLIDDIITQKSMEYHNKCLFQFNDHIKHNQSIWLYINYNDFKHKIDNLIDNAFEAIKNNIGEKLIAFSISNDESYVYLKIEDNGYGITHETLEKINKHVFISHQYVGMLYFL